MEATHLSQELPLIGVGDEMQLAKRVVDAHCEQLLLRERVSNLHTSVCCQVTPSSMHTRQ